MMLPNAHSLQDLLGKLMYTCWISKKMLWEKVEENYRDAFSTNRRASNWKRWHLIVSSSGISKDLIHKCLKKMNTGARSLPLHKVGYILRSNSREELGLSLIGDRPQHSVFQCSGLKKSPKHDTSSH